MRTEAAIRNALLMYCSWRDNHDGGLLPFSPDTTSRIASTVLFQVGAVLAVLPLPDRKLAVSAFRTESADWRPGRRVALANFHARPCSWTFPRAPAIGSD